MPEQKQLIPENYHTLNEQQKTIVATNAALEIIKQYILNGGDAQVLVSNKLHNMVSSIKHVLG